MERPPQIPRAEAIGPEAIRARRYDIGQEIDRVLDEAAANRREAKEISDRLHFLFSEDDRLQLKQRLLGEED